MSSRNDILINRYNADRNYELENWFCVLLGGTTKKPPLIYIMGKSHSEKYVEIISYIDEGRAIDDENRPHFLSDYVKYAEGELTPEKFVFSNPVLPDSYIALFAQRLAIEAVEKLDHKMDQFLDAKVQMGKNKHGLMIKDFLHYSHDRNQRITN